MASGAAGINQRGRKSDVVTPSSPWGEQNQDGHHGQDNEDHRCDVGTGLFSGGTHCFFKIVCN